jgi:hypothetical protein
MPGLSSSDDTFESPGLSLPHLEAPRPASEIRAEHSVATMRTRTASGSHRLDVLGPRGDKPPGWMGMIDSPWLVAAGR